MKLSGALLVLIAFCVLAAPSFATLSYVHPSGNGASPCPQDPNGCMESSAATGFSILGAAGVVTDLSYLTDGSSDGTSTTYTYFDLFNINGINPGTTVTFTFSSMATYTYALAHMNISGCDLDSFGNPGVFDSNNNNLGLPCTNASSDGSVFFKETDNSGAFQIQLNFSCSSDPTVSNSCTLFPTSYSGVDINNNPANFDWGFIVLDDINGQGLGTPSSVSLSTGSVTTPEPNSLSMLVLGLLALGLLSLKKLQTF
jgi:hypothetical protein